MNTLERDDLIDRCKGIGIILVVVGHCLGGLLNARLVVSDGWVDKAMSIIYAFHMPLFFFVSGHLFRITYKKSSFFADVRSKATALLYPYFIWSVIYIGLEIVAGKEELTYLIFYKLIDTIYIPVAHYWFLHALFLINFACISFVHLFGFSRRQFLLFVAVILFAMNSVEISTNQFVAFSQNFIYFVIGLLFSGFIMEYMRVSAALKFAIFIAIFLVVFYFQQFTYTLAVVRHFLLAIFGISVVLGLAVLTNKEKFFEFVGRLSMPIYLMHTIFAWQIRLVLIRFGVFNLVIHLIGEVLLPIFLSIIVYRFFLFINMSWLFYCPGGRVKSKV